ncbi:conserved Plasmodium membrane protein, unknown function [Babesia microti strain RI]|uniref:Uncharacterized protein n=1 Tax=Babesia microti (strain RI) TaxID=1133968 RepID=A0A1R4A9X5_BABMR|nr:conserved Plasmodium membrane protein, unknown function [Babesia microti strain RI]SJK85790.1 conserved Plasmodium membrane protein, unknown function [Babesia microti strain RI]|eukprot:XP_021338012.1 conserved Plasmodium membrane protein, unknown function [Babesia microti strain RI]
MSNAMARARACYHHAPIPRHWGAFVAPMKYRTLSYAGLSTVFGGAVLVHYLESTEREDTARDILSAEIHLISCLTAFSAGMTSGLENALNCGLLPRSLDWRSHVRHMGGISAILLTSFASGLSYNSPRDSLYLLLAAAGFTLVSDAALRQRSFPLWFFGYKKKFIFGLSTSIIALLTCESQQLPGRALHIDQQDDLRKV